MIVAADFEDPLPDRLRNIVTYYKKRNESPKVGEVQT